MPSKTEEYSRPCPAHGQRLDPVLGKLDGLPDHRIPAVQVSLCRPVDDSHAQRPDATACADFVIWNNRMNRYVGRGAIPRSAGK